MKYKIQNINNQNFHKFGDLISIKEKHHEEINENTTNSFFDLANIQIEGEDKRVRLNLFEAKKRIFPLKIDMLENHPFSSQVFLPLGNHPFIVVVCPASEKPNLKDLNLFRVNNGFGINFKPRVWHFPLISIEDAKFITIDKKNDEGNLEIYKFDEDEVFSIDV